MSKKYKQSDKILHLAVLVIVLMAIFLGLNKSPNFFSEASSVIYSITLNQPSPKYGDTVDFTAVYPKEAARRIGKQQIYQPVIHVRCNQNNELVLDRRTYIESSTQNGDGSITGITYDIVLSGIYWTGGEANCSVALYYFATKNLIYKFLDQKYFLVAE